MRKPNIQQKPRSKPKKPQRPPCAGSKTTAPVLAAWKSTCPVCKRLLKLRGSTTGDALCFPRHCPPAPKREKVIPDVSNTMCPRRIRSKRPGEKPVECRGLIEAVVSGHGITIGYICQKCRKHYPKATTTDISGNERNKP